MADKQQGLFNDSSADEFEISSSDNEKPLATPHTEYTCEYCSIKFRKHAKYIRHLRTHTKEVFVVFMVIIVETLFMHISRL